MSAILVVALAGCGRDQPLQALAVIDGDTLELDGRVIELWGIDAPELGQQCLDGSHLYACGREVAFDLDKLVTLDRIQCAPAEDTDYFECQTADGSVSLLLVHNGLVVARAGGEMSSAERQARRVPLGIWRGPFVDPRDWRGGKRLPEEERDPETPCPILGLEEDGSRFYLVPTDADYRSWSSDDAEVAERFCSDEEARTKGYVHRRPTGSGAE